MSYWGLPNWADNHDVRHWIKKRELSPLQSAHTAEESVSDR